MSATQGQQTYIYASYDGGSRGKNGCAITYYMICAAQRILLSGVDTFHGEVQSVLNESQEAFEGMDGWRHDT